MHIPWFVYLLGLCFSAVCVLSYFAYNAPLHDKDGNPISDDDSTYGAPEGDFTAVLRSRERQAP